MSVNKNKILGIDYGDYTIGLAIFDRENDFIYPYKTITRDRANVLRKSIREICDIIENENITELVVGLPLNLDGTEGDRVDKTKEFIKMLKNKIGDIKITLQDERLTTMAAEEILLNNGIKKSEHKKVIDQVAATIILNDYKQKQM